MSVKKFRKKPVIIEAIQLTTSNLEAVIDWLDAPHSVVSSLEPRVDIQTLEGVITAVGNDWIIKGVKGEFYPCKPDVFNATYEGVE